MASSRRLFALACVALICVAHIRACTWSVTNAQFATIAAGLAFTSSTNGFSPIADNGSGSFILTTADGGKTWTNYPASGLMYLGAAASGSSYVVSDTFGLQFSWDGGKTFNNSILSTGITSQNVMSFPTVSGGFGAAGQSLFGDNGVAVSTDSGLSFTMYNISLLQTESRYAAYPSATTWYVSAGAWPNNADSTSASSVYDASSRVSVVMNEDGKMSYKGYAPRPRVAMANDSGWQAQIVKTTDGGKTWTSLYLNFGEFYFNQIDCISETHCVAVAEADTSSAPGVRIFTTFDGKTFTQTYYNPDGNESLMAVRFIDEQNVIAAGGLLSETAFTGKFYVSADGGKTWTIQELADVYTNAMSFPPGSPTVGYATAFNAESTSSFLTCA